MTVLANPVLRDATAENNAYRGFALSQMNILKDYMIKAKLNVYSRSIVLANGTVITCKKCYNREDIFITMPSVKTKIDESRIKTGIFLFNNKAFSRYSMLYDFNGYEDSPFTQNRMWDGGDTWKASLNSQATEYGNTDWKGFGGQVLSWKGVASRYFETDIYFDGGYMMYDEDVVIYSPDPLTVPAYTPFSEKIFYHGQALSSIPTSAARIYLNGVVQRTDSGTRTTNGTVIYNYLPTPASTTVPKVLGCAFCTHDSKTNLVAIVSKNYRGLTNPAGTTGGFYYESYVFEDGAWCRINYFAGGRPVANWFFNQSGNEAQCIQSKTIMKITISKTTDGWVSAITSTPAGSGTSTESATVTNVDLKTYDATGLNYWDFSTRVGGGTSAGTQTDSTVAVNETQTETIAIDYVDDVAVIATVTYSFTETSVYNSTTETYVAWIPEVDARDGSSAGNRFANVGKKVYGSWLHTSSANTILTAPFGAKTLFSRTRIGGVDYKDRTYSPDAYSYQPLRSDTSTSSSYQVNPTLQQTYSCEFKESQAILNTEIYFMDLRHGIYVVKETATSFSKDVTSADSIEWNQYGVVIPLHKIIPGDLNLTVVETIKLNDEIIDTKTSAAVSQINYGFAFPAYGGTPQVNQTIDYYIWSEHVDNDGGYDLYYPAWLQGLSPMSANLDLGNRNRHKRIITNQAALPGTQAVALGDLYKQSIDVKGAWATSPIKADGVNLKAYATLKLNNTSFKNFIYPPYIVDGVDATDALLGSPSNLVTPITPL